MLWNTPVNPDRCLKTTTSKSNQSTNNPNKVNIKANTSQVV